MDSKPALERLEHMQLDDFIKSGFRTFVEATKAANDLPKNRDYDFYNAHASFATSLDTQSDRLLHLINQLLKASDIAGNIKSASLACKTELIGEANDAILDKAVAVIDEMNGLKSLPSAPVIQTVSANITVNGSWNQVHRIRINEQENEMNKQNSISLLTAKNIVRPQSYFKDKVENGNANPWKPRITEKPNSLKPLALYLEPSEEDESFEEWSHPYEYELEHFKVPEKFLVPVKPEPVKHLKDTPLHEITTEGQLDDLVEELRKHREIAVDLEHHSYRTFQGITCLMQISTRDADYLVDTLELRHKLYVLNEVFTKPSILKIFHGADMDVQWLQRDLSLYVVNMFDTHRAAKTLGYSGVSLAYLLNRFCSFMPNKKFQLADWRIRPMPQALKDYAREDTHYLIYVYEMLKKELYREANGNDNLLQAVFQSSTEVCKTKYTKPRWTPDAHLKLCMKRKKMFDNRQMSALRDIYKWRDAIAREEDESIGYVLPNRMMLQIAELLPREVQGMFACCSPIPPLVRAHSLELHHIILKAREQPLVKPILQETNRRIVSKEVVRVNIDSPLHCPHDLTKYDQNDNFPTLLNSATSKDINQNVLPLEQVNSTCKIFNDAPVPNKLVRKKLALTFLGPFERYKLIKPYLQAEADRQAKEAEEKEKDNNKGENEPTVAQRVDALHKHCTQIQERMKSNAGKSDEDVHIMSEGKVRAGDDFFSSLATEISLEKYPVPLINMPGSKKRKRDGSLDRMAPNLIEPGREGEQYVNGNESKKRKTKKNKKKQNNTNQERPSPSESGNVVNGKKQHGWKGNKSQERRGPAQPFDYSQVDYNQFRGGGRNVAYKQFETKHRGKGQNKRGGRGRGRGSGSQNQSMTFRHARGRSSFRAYEHPPK